MFLRKAGARAKTQENLSPARKYERLERRDKESKQEESGS